MTDILSLGLRNTSKLGAIPILSACQMGAQRMWVRPGQCVKKKSKKWAFLPILFYLFNLCIYTHTCHCVLVEIRDQLARAGSLLPSCGFWASSWVLQTRWQTPFTNGDISLSLFPHLFKRMRPLVSTKGTASISRAPNLPSLLYCRAPKCTTSGQVPKHQQEVPTTACGQAGRGD